MASLPVFKNDDTQFQMMQQKWAALLNPLLANPINEALMLKSVKLTSGENSVPHLLQKNIQGWFIVGINKPAIIYDKQADNQSPQLTLKLVSDMDCTVNLMVF